MFCDNSTFTGAIMLQMGSPKDELVNFDRKLKDFMYIMYKIIRLFRM